MARRKEPATSKMLKSFNDAKQQYREVKADYDMSKPGRFNRQRTGLPSQGNSADWHYRVESRYYRDIEAARDMDRNDMIVGQIVTRAVDNVIQDGFTLSPTTGDTGLDTELYDRWMAWAGNPEECDIQGEYAWHDFERLNCRSMLVDGDIVNLALETGHLQCIEGHEIQTRSTVPNVFCGVERDDYGKRVRYYIMRDPLDPKTGTKQESLPVDVRDAAGNRQLFHIFNSRRMSATRGVTAFAPIFIAAGIRDDIDFAQLVIQQIASCFAIFRKRPAAGNAAPHAQGYGNGSTETTASGETRYIEEIEPGMEVIGQPGEELSGFSPDVPSSSYQWQHRMMLQAIGVNLGLPLCLVLMDGSETNFSGWRGAVDEARKGFKSLQRNMVKRSHSPTYQWKVRQWIEEDPLIRRYSQLPRIRIASHQWNTPVWQYIDPVADAQGDQIRLINGLISPRRLHSERGREWETVADETIEDLAYAIRMAKKTAATINGEFKDNSPVHWRELINLPMPGGVQMTVQDKQTKDGKEPLRLPVGDVVTKPVIQTDQKQPQNALPADVEKVADTALNGAQVQAASSIVEKVAQGLLPRGSGIAQLQIFFQLTLDQAEKIIGDAGTSKFIPATDTNTNANA